MQNTTIKDLIIEKFGLTDMPADLQDSTAVEIANNLMSMVVTRIIADNNDQFADELNAFLDSDPPAEEMAPFLSSRVPNFEQIVGEELAKLVQGTEEVLSQTINQVQDEAAIEQAQSEN